MSISENKYYVRVLKVIFGGLSLFLIFAFYVFSTLAKEQTVALYFIFLVYFEFLCIFTVLLGLYRRLKKFYTYFILSSSLLLTFVVVYSLINNYNLDIQTLVAFSLFFYLFSLILTKYLADFFSLFIRVLLGKDTDCLGDDFRCISIYTKNTDQLPFIENIINNVLGFSIEMEKAIVLNENEYEVFEFKKKDSKSFIHHLILIPTARIFDEDDELCIDNESCVDDGFNNFFYNGFFIYQYYEDSDLLYQGTSFNYVYSTFANILTNHDIKIYFDENYIPIYDTLIHENKVVDSSTLLHKYIITYYKKDDRASTELVNLRDKLCQNYLDMKYKPVIDLIDEAFSRMLKKKHTRTILCLTLVVLISLSIVYGIHAYTNDLIQTITVTFAIPAGLYSIVSLYDRFFQKIK